MVPAGGERGVLGYGIAAGGRVEWLSGVSEPEDGREGGRDGGRRDEVSG